MVALYANKCAIRGCDLGQTELSSMGKTIKLAVAALERIDDVEKVYIAGFGEGATHFHIHIFPKYKWMLNYPASDICTENKLDGAKLFSFCRQRYKTNAEYLKNPAILAVVNSIQNYLSYYQNR